MRLLVLRLEIWPRGDDTKKRDLGQVRIGNVTEDGPETYDVEFVPPLEGIERSRVRTKIVGWDRGKDAWALAFEALKRLGCEGWLWRQ